MARILPWLLLAAVTTAMLAYVATYGANLPRADEWRDSLVLLEGRPLTISWLWAAHNVHRAPLSRLIRYLLYAATGDFRAALVFSVLVMAAAAAIFLAAVRRLRGAPSWTDLFVPLVVAGPGHFMNFLWGFQVAFTLSAALFMATISLIAVSSGSPPPRRMAAVAALGLLQILTGANGLAFALPVLAWVAWWAVAAGDGSAWRNAALAATAAAGLVALAYPLGLEVDPMPAPLGDAVRATLQFIGSGLTSAAPWWQGRAFLALVLAAGAVVLLAGAPRDPDGAPWRSRGLLACLAACAVLALMVGYGRRGFGDQAGLFPRYTTLAAPLLCIIFVAFMLHGRSRWARAVPGLLAVLALPTLLINAAMAVGYAEPRRRQIQDLSADASRGLPLEAIAARNGTAIYQYTPGVMVYLDRLVEAGAWPFQDYQVDPAVDASVAARVEERLSPRALKDLAPEGGGFAATGPGPQLELALERTRPVAGIQITFVLDSPQLRPMRLEIHWDAAGQGGEAAYPWWTRRAAFPVEPDGEEQSLMVWIYGTIDRLRIDPGQPPLHFRVTGLTVLELAPGWLPEAGGAVP